jgi:hypothetical protein
LFCIVKQSDGGKKTRIYLAPCQLETNTNSKYGPRQMILAAIMTTLCVESRNHFILYDTEQRQCELWKGTSILKEFWCCPEVPIDIEAIIEASNRFLHNRLWFYDEKRRCKRNTQNPGNYGPDWQRDNHLELSAKWELKNGPPSVGLINKIDENPILLESQVAYNSRVLLKKMKVFKENLK